MSDWIHCNKCTIKFSTTIKFYLTECGHLYCHRCVESVRNNQKCTICLKPTTVLLLNKDVDHNIQGYFQPLENLIKKTVEIYEFQSQHRNLLFQTLLNKYHFAKKECINQNNINKHLQKENKILRSMLRASGQDIQTPFKTSTPMSTATLFNNQSVVSSHNNGTQSENNGSGTMFTRFAPQNGLKSVFSNQSCIFRTFSEDFRLMGHHQQPKWPNYTNNGDSLIVPELKRCAL